MSYNDALDGHILNVVQNSEIREQGDLQDILKKRGFDVPQATLSRRLRRLKIAKVGGVYKVVDFSQPNLPLVLNMQVSDFGQIILHTHPGQANSLAYFIDQKYVDFSPKRARASGILGTIAGDDTVLLVVKSRDDVDKVVSLLQEEFSYLGTSEE